MTTMETDKDMSIADVATLYPIDAWIPASDVKALPSSVYWNDKSNENGKVFDVSDGNFSKLSSSRKLAALRQQLDELLSAGKLQLRGRGLSLAAGVCWLEAGILRDNPAIEVLTCVEFSRHRIEGLAPRILAHEGIDPTRVNLCFGSFYDIKLPDSSVDFVLLSQAFHHAHEPERLLREISRVLTPEGVVLIIGEHWFSKLQIADRVLRHFAKYLTNHKEYRLHNPFFPDWRTCFPVSNEKGDHHYTVAMYRAIFRNHSFAAQRIVNPAFGTQGYLLRRSQKVIC